MADFLVALITASSKDEARLIARMVIDENLAACTLAVPSVQSTYRWKGTIVETEEAMIFVKMLASKFEALEKRVREMHSYECPCIIAFPLTAGSAPYFSWLEAQTT